MVLEVNEEPLPAGWEVLMSRSKNMPYYSNLKTKKVYWVDDELPRGWSHQFDQKGTTYYFHIKDKNGTISYEKPVLRQQQQQDQRPHELPPSPDPLPVPAPSYGHNDRDRVYSQDLDTQSYDHDRRRYSEDSSHSAASPARGLQIDSNPPPLPRKKSNSLMDLLSPGPPALGADERSPRRTY